MKQPELGKRLNEIRIQKGITQKELSDLCSVDIRTIYSADESKIIKSSQAALKSSAECQWPRYAHAPLDRAVGRSLGATENPDKRRFSSAIPP